MDKTLHTIQTLSKVGRVLSKIAMIVCIVGAAVCLLGIASLAVGASGVLVIGGVSIHGVIEGMSDMPAAQMYAAMAGVMVACAAEAVLAGFSAQYFKNELIAGTPFTMDGAKEMKRLGILGICLPIGGKVATEIICAITASAMSVPTNLGEGFGFETSVGAGIAFLVVSLLCRYVAESRSPYLP